MAFAARQHEGKWRLCLRKGITFTTINRRWPVEIVFPSQAKAKACADELNAGYWKAYEKAAKQKDPPILDYSVMDPMIIIVRKHEGVTAADFQRIFE